MAENEGGLGCPECGAPRGPSHAPSCDCTQRASEALRAFRTAEAAAAEDFGPLRIRPYVEVGGEADGDVPAPVGDPVRGEGPPAPAGATAPEDGADAAGATGEARPGPAGAAHDGGAARAHAAHEPEDPPAEPAEGARSDGSGAAGEATPPPRGPAGGEPRLFAAERKPTAQDRSPALLPSEGGRGRRTRRAVLLGAAGAAVVVVAAAGVASGLFSYAEPVRDRTAPEIRQSVPDVTQSRSASPSSAAPAVSSRPPVRSAPPAPPTRIASRTPSPSAPTPRASRSTGRTASPSPSATPTAGQVLRPGDRGPAVMDLQVRLQELNLYNDRIDGMYTLPVEDAVREYQVARGIRADTLGVYGPATRRSLESETW